MVRGDARSTSSCASSATARADFTGVALRAYPLRRRLPLRAPKRVVPERVEPERAEAERDEVEPAAATNAEAPDESGCTLGV